MFVWVWMNVSFILWFQDTDSKAICECTLRAICSTCLCASLVISWFKSNLIVPSGASEDLFMEITLSCANVLKKNILLVRSLFNTWIRINQRFLIIFFFALVFYWNLLHSPPKQHKGKWSSQAPVGSDVEMKFCSRRICLPRPSLAHHWTRHAADVTGRITFTMKPSGRISYLCIVICRSLTS